jgi:hypothetical protein
MRAEGRSERVVENPAQPKMDTWRKKTRWGHTENAEGRMGRAAVAQIISICLIACGRQHSIDTKLQCYAV